jgi:hypothetical protein
LIRVAWVKRSSYDALDKSNLAQIDNANLYGDMPIYALWVDRQWDWPPGTRQLTRTDAVRADGHSTALDWSRSISGSGLDKVCEQSISFPNSSTVVQDCEHLCTRDGQDQLIVPYEMLTQFR